MTLLLFGERNCLCLRTRGVQETDRTTDVTGCSVVPMPFEKFDRRESKYVKRPQLTVQAQGAISINAAAYRALGDPSHVELFFDRDERIIGIAAAPADTEYGYPIRSQGAKRSSFVMSARAFLIKFGIPYEVSKRFNAEMTDNLLIARLNDEASEPENAEVSA
jgi:hypothetical protein